VLRGLKLALSTALVELHPDAVKALPSRPKPIVRTAVARRA
jgi:hypothetical protein